MAHILDGFNSGFTRPTPPPKVTLDALLGDFEASFRPNSPAQNELPKAPPIAFKLEPSNAKPFTFMSAAPKKKDPEMAPATAPTMSGP